MFCVFIWQKLLKEKERKERKYEAFEDCQLKEITSHKQKYMYVVWWIISIADLKMVQLNSPWFIIV